MEELELKLPVVLTKIDCSTFSSATRTDSLSVCFNPDLKPGVVAFAGVVSSGSSISSQLSLKLALDRFVSSVSEAAANSEDLLVEKVLEAAFQATNSEVYQFGHQLSAGGRLGAGLVALYLRDSEIALARVGCGSSYLFRGSDLFPFFAEEVESSELLGQNATVKVELSASPVDSDDLIIIFDRVLSADQSAQLLGILPELIEDDRLTAREISRELLIEDSTLEFISLVKIASKAIFLDRSMIIKD